ncbi:MAG: LysE family translocator [Pseudomonadota bacterium]
MPTPTLTTFAVMQLLFAVSPGPAVVLTTSRAASEGVRQGLSVAAGVLGGNAIYLLLSALGVGLLLHRFPGAMDAIRLLGAAFLAWRGACILIEAVRPGPSAASPSRPTRTTRHGFLDGLGCQLANPKSMLFFGALLPLFVTPDGPLAPQYLVLGLLCLVIEWPVLALYATLAALAGRLAPSPGAARLRRIGTGLCLLGVAASVLAASGPVV